MGYTRFADPFWGNGISELPKPHGPAASWFFLKAQTGDTHPGAALPFGWVTAGAYSGAYPTGYGLNMPSTFANVPKRYPEYCATGFSHFHPSGTGMLENYYNYFRVTPLSGSVAQYGNCWRLENEIARPGFYQADISQTGIRAELTVTERTALHRYTFSNGEPHVLIDFADGGLLVDKKGHRPESAEIEIMGPDTFQGYVTMQGIRIYVYLQACFPVQSARIWQNQSSGQIGDKFQYHKNSDSARTPKFGVIFTADGDPQSCELRLGFSMRSQEQARQNLETTTGFSFDEIVQQADKKWEDALSRIQIETENDDQQRLFYSALYHSLIKPMNCHDESPFWQTPSCWLDFATLGEMYKTQLPLVFSLFPEQASDIVTTLLEAARYHGKLPNTLLMDQNFAKTNCQIRGLVQQVIVDVFNRKISGDWQEIFSMLLTDLEQEANDDFLTKNCVRPFSHTLDLADACTAIARIAKHLGEIRQQKRLEELAQKWRNVFNPNTALLDSAILTEDGVWNHSFRILHDMASRIDFYSSETDFIADLDQFFGWNAPPVKQPKDSRDTEYMQYGHSLNRFEGFNNETDMETPYAYLYAGRPDRTAAIIRSGMTSMFANGRGGLPGNNDSGALSSCFVWNTVGLFPVTGQPVLLIGSPLFTIAKLKFGENSLEIRTVNNSSKNIYVQRATWNNHPINRAYLTMSEALAGGTLELIMGPEPSEWATTTRPPSFPTV